MMALRSELRKDEKNRKERCGKEKGMQSNGRKYIKRMFKIRKRAQRQLLAWLLMAGTLTSLIGGGLLLLPEQNRFAQASERYAESELSSAWSPDAIERGVHYELTGDRDAWYQDASGLFWVRKGTALYAVPKTGSGYDSGMTLENVQTDGTFSFHLRVEDDSGKVLRESAAASTDYRVDEEAPAARFLISGVCQESIYYNSEFCTVLIYIEQDGESGLKNAFYKVASCDQNGSVAEGTESSVWVECESGSILQISETGMFRIYVKTEDMVGNVRFSGSDVFDIG